MKLIKSIKSTITRINAYGDTINAYQHSESLYNERGHETSSVLFNEDGEIENKSMFEVGEDGNILSQIHYERSNDLVERTDFFDTDDSIQYKSEITTKDGSKTIHEYHYNQIGNTDLITIKNEDGSVEAYEIFKFNDKKAVIEEVRTNENYVPQFTKKLFYDQIDRLLKEEYFDSKNRLHRVVDYQYNERGLLETKIDTNQEFSSITLNKYTYDLTGNQILDETFQNAMLSFKNQCKYDDWNNLIEEKIIQTGQENFIEIIQHSIEYQS